MSDILSEIIAHKRLEVAAAKRVRPPTTIEAAAAAAPPARDFIKALSDLSSTRIIAECKRQSPSRGLLAPNYDPVALAKAYERGGAAAISVLTDENYFGGALAHLTAVREAVAIHVLRKDFIVDPYQVYEARAAGADTFLLLSGVLDTTALKKLIALGRSLGMEPLIESHTDAELTAALASEGMIFGINNRDLKTFHIDLGPARALLEQARAGDPSRIVVCESGIKSRSDVELMTSVGYNVFLIGEALVTHQDPQAGLQSLILRR